MAIGRDFASLLGVSEDASEAEVDARREALSDFFGSAEVPAGLQEWARLQALKLAETQAMNFPIGSQDSSAIAEPVEVDAQPTSLSGSRRYLDRLLTSWIVVCTIVLVAVIGGVVFAKLDPLATADRGPRPLPEAAAPAPLDDGRIAELNGVVSNDPHAAAALRELGETYFVAGHWQQSVDWLTRLLAVDTTDARAFADIGTASFNLGRRDDAKAFWLAGLAVSPGDPLIHYSLGHLFATSSPPDLPAAQKEWKAAISAAPGSSLAAAAQHRIEDTAK